MKIVLFRHGAALDREDSQKLKLEDSLRPLVEKGCVRTAKMAKILRDFDMEIDFIVSSPYLRAVETADILATDLDCKQYFESIELVPSAPPAAFAQWLNKHSKTATSVLVVGHEPHLSHFASWLIAGESESILDLKKSGMACIEVESLTEIKPRSGILQWLIQPKMIE